MNVDKTTRKVNDRGFSGEITDEIKFVEDGEFSYEGGTIKGKKGESFKLPVSHNLVVDACSKLLASLMKNQSGYKGIKYWEVGSGQENWVDNSPPNPVPGDTALNNPLARKEVQASDIKFLTASNVETDTVTNKIQIKVTFPSSEANGPLREFGLFGGGVDCTTALGTGLMINRKTHGLIHKTTGVELTRTLILSF